ncbi:DUF2157 domain-containing protein [Cyclobacterium plantarum]|uniref:DUF2157 domain-containing protein n=1 Tax=Cyclobacterium plantarum TaxID=2716263 RepID=A0ABX0H5U4_9BACT|nr:DUF2157 domain-containing protein [Cyclobacterium plantarum]NHE57224.1 DUF2157 domain-containing protein [Cyclobacterium plantarum]
MNLVKDIPELINAGVISPETAGKIRDYYGEKGGQSTNRLFVVFGILGAILVGLGIILLLAHNWDEFSRTAKTCWAFLPLLIGQVLCGFVLIKKPESVAWRESGTAFLFFAVGASISLVSQIYHMPGDLGLFLLTWMLLCLPLIYVMKSSIASLLYLIGITCYAAETSYWTYPATESYSYWILLLTILPHYNLLSKTNPESNFMVFHNWIIPLSVVIALGTVAGQTDELMVPAYFSLFGLIYLIGELDFFTRQRPANNGYKVLGLVGTIVMLLTFSFDWFWEHLRKEDFPWNEVFTSPEFLAAFLLTLSGIGLLVINLKNSSLTDIKPIGVVFLLFIVIFIIGLSSSLSVVLVNILVFAIGMLTIRDGARRNNLGILNLGLLIIAALVVCRFFDTNLSFIIRGGLFVSVGIGFMATNYWMLKKRNPNG